MKNVVLIGFMGTGKTSAGKLLAARLGSPFIDTDMKIEQENHLTIPEIFAAHGEAYFRDLETAAVKMAAQGSNLVISTGGGVVLRGENMAALRRNGWIITLTASVDCIVARTSRDNERPLLLAEDRQKMVETLLAQRASLYADADFIIDTGTLTPLQVVEEILKFLKRKGDPRA